jgi:hypothetical protein
VQQGDFPATPCHGQRLRGVHQERTGEERHERERRQVRAVRARQLHGIVAGLAGRDDFHAGRQQRLNGVADIRNVCTGIQTQLDAVESADTAQAPLCGRDVQHPDRLAVHTRRDQARHVQPDEIEADLYIERIHGTKCERRGGRCAQPDGVLRQ